MPLRFFDEGYKEGYEHGQKVGLAEGRELGKEKGFEIWEEIGFYEGFTKIFKAFYEKEVGNEKYNPLICVIWRFLMIFADLLEQFALRPFFWIS